MMWETSYGPYVKLIVTATESEVNTATNTSKVTVNAKLYYPGTPSANNALPQTLVVNIDGTRVATVEGITYSLSSKASKVLGTWSKVVTHNSDGKKNAAIYVSINDFNGDVGTVSQSLGLTDIPRTSTFTIPSSFTVGSAFTVSISRASSSFTHAVVLHDRDYVLYSSGNTVGTSVSPNVTANTLIARMSGVKSKAFTVQVDTYNGSTYIGSTSKTITANIPTSQVTLNNAERELGQTVRITTNRASEDLFHRIEYEYKNESGLIAGGAGNYADWVLPNSLANEIVKSDRAYVNIICKTYNGNTLVGTNTITILAVVPNKAPFTPSATLGVSEGASGLTQFTNYIKTKSKVSASAVGYGTFGSWVSSSDYRITVDGINYYGENITSNTLTNHGTITITLRVKDSRGHFAYDTKTINVLDYYPPKIYKLEVKRSPNDNSENLNANIHYGTTGLANENTKHIMLEYRQTNGSWYELDVWTDLYSNNFGRTYNGIIDGNLSYEVRLVVSDYFTAASLTRPIATAYDLINFNASGKGIAFGKVSQKDGFELNMPIYPLNSNYAMFDFIIAYGTVGNKSYVQYNSGRMTQTTRLRVTLNTNNSIGTMFHSWGTNLTFEKYFTNVPDVTYSVQQESGGSAILRQDSPPAIGTAAGTYSYLSPVSANITATIIVKGEGEWK